MPERPLIIRTMDEGPQVIPPYKTGMVRFACDEPGFYLAGDDARTVAAALDNEDQLPDELLDLRSWLRNAGFGLQEPAPQLAAPGRVFVDVLRCCECGRERLAIRSEHTTPCFYREPCLCGQHGYEVKSTHPYKAEETPAV